jgi:glycosyltransferase involved in cell wall biosynthesis
MPRMTEDGRSSRIRFLSCFFPAFNEEENVAAVLDEALSTLPRFADDFEVIVVDDGSSDRTAEVVAAYAQGRERVRLVSHEQNRGYGEALRSGLAAARGDAVFFTDADRQFRLADIERLLAHYDGSPFVVGYRQKRNDPWHRLVVARVYHAVLKAVFGLRLRDVDCAFKLFGRDVLDRIRPELQSRSAFISPELLIRAQMTGVTIAEVGVPHYPRAAGRPKGATPKVIARTIKEIFVMRRRLGRAAARESAKKLPAGR